MKFLSNIESLNVHFKLSEDETNILTRMEDSLQSIEGSTVKIVSSSLATTDPSKFIYRLTKSLPPVELLMVEENSQVVNNHLENH